MPFCPRRGKKRRHTLKAQVLLNWDTQQIIATAFGKGRTHDFRLFKLSCAHVHPNTMVQADLGYLGLDRLHAHTFLPAKATRHHPLSHEEKQANRALDKTAPSGPVRTLARLRLHIERVIGRLKVFRILSERYRGRRKRFGLRFNLISGIHDFELSLKS